MNNFFNKLFRFVAMIFFGIYTKIVQIMLIPLFFVESKVFSSSKINERPIEYSFLFKHLWRICPKSILDIGSGESALPHLMASCGFNVTSTDKKGDYWDFYYFNRHYPIQKDDITSTKLQQKFDLITCLSVLEHIPNSDNAINNIFKLLKTNGYLILSYPYNPNKYIDNVYELDGAGYGQDAPYICQIFSDKNLNDWLYQNNGKIIDQEYYKVFAGDFWTFGDRIYPPRKVLIDDNPHLTCIIIQKI
jgi:2-polyprenyl-3-methyl-5-hydroxy-6-metoxy-1,4-benzoquinol methylase